MNGVLHTGSPSPASCADRSFLVLSLKTTCCFFEMVALLSDALPLAGQYAHGPLYLLPGPHSGLPPHFLAVLETFFFPFHPYLHTAKQPSPFGSSELAGFLSQSLPR